MSLNGFLDPSARQLLRDTTRSCWERKTLLPGIFYCPMSYKCLILPKKLTYFKTDFNVVVKHFKKVEFTRTCRGRKTWREIFSISYDKTKLRGSGVRQSRLENWPLSDSVLRVLLVLHNGGFCNACTIKQSITLLCIPKQSTWQYGVVP
jgi:hypothetical protein